MKYKFIITVMIWYILKIVIKDFLKTMREIWNKIIKLINKTNAPNFVQNTLDDDS